MNLSLRTLKLREIKWLYNVRAMMLLSIHPQICVSTKCACFILAPGLKTWRAFTVIMHKFTFWRKWFKTVCLFKNRENNFSPSDFYMHHYWQWINSYQLEENYINLLCIKYVFSLCAKVLVNLVCLISLQLTYHKNMVNLFNIYQTPNIWKFQS